MQPMNAEPAYIRCVRQLPGAEIRSFSLPDFEAFALGCAMVPAREATTHSNEEIPSHLDTVNSTKQDLLSADRLTG